MRPSVGCQELRRDYGLTRPNSQILMLILLGYGAEANTVRSGDVTIQIPDGGPPFDAELVDDEFTILSLH